MTGIIDACVVELSFLSAVDGSGNCLSDATLSLVVDESDSGPELCDSIVT